MGQHRSIGLWRRWGCSECKMRLFEMMSLIAFFKMLCFRLFFKNTTLVKLSVFWITRSCLAWQKIQFSQGLSARLLPESRSGAWECSGKPLVPTPRRRRSLLRGSPPKRWF